MRVLGVIWRYCECLVSVQWLDMSYVRCVEKQRPEAKVMEGQVNVGHSSFLIRRHTAEREKSEGSLKACLMRRSDGQSLTT